VESSSSFKLASCDTLIEICLELRFFKSSLGSAGDLAANNGGVEVTELAADVDLSVEEYLDIAVF
jgi:hypothetical protein